jgi:HK97 family phage prohead protease
MSDFKIYTNALKAYEADNGDRFVTGTTSSTIRDLHGDEMTLSALKSMEATAKQNMTIWLNHEYQVPDDLFGSVKDARIVKRIDEDGQEVFDLDVDISVVSEDENPEAIRAYRAIKRGVKLGLSIGARVDRVSKKVDKSTGEETYVIDSVKLMEASVVGIPANQRSYLQNAVKSLRSASIEEQKAAGGLMVVETHEVEEPGEAEVLTSGIEQDQRPQGESLEVKNVENETINPEAIEPAAEEVVAVEETAAEEEPKPHHIAVLEEFGAEVVKDTDLEIAARQAQAAADAAAAVEPEAPAEEKVEEAPVVEAPAVEPEAPAEAPATEIEHAAEPEAAADDKSVDTAALAEVAEIAKSALDAALAAQAEVTALKKSVAEVIAAKAKVELELEKTLDLVGRLIDVPVGHVPAFKRATGEMATSAPWLSPYIQRVLETQE